MERRGFLGSLLGLAAAKLMPDPAPPLAPVGMPTLWVPYSSTAITAGSDCTITVTGNIVTGEQVWDVSGLHTLTNANTGVTFTYG